MILAIEWIVAKVLDQTAPEPTHHGLLAGSRFYRGLPRETDQGTGVTPTPTTARFVPCNFGVDYCERRDRVAERKRPT
jgi:hypothetical protein